jgi:predicted lysophospholipase L1 biosynthesis ABC-type transport system permease subunit
VLARLVWPAALGLCGGTLAAFAATPWLRPLLFGVSTLDARAFAAGWAAVVLAGLAAAVVPLNRACRLDPRTLLRSE